MGLYTGLWANFLLCLNPAIKHAVFDQVPLVYFKDVDSPAANK